MTTLEEIKRRLIESDRSPQDLKIALAIIDAAEQEHDASKVIISFDPSEENDEVIAITIKYYSSIDDFARDFPHWVNIDTTTIDQYSHYNFEIQRLLNFCDGIEIRPLTISVMCRTPYGTYKVKRYWDNRFKQRAGWLLGYNDA